MRVVSLLPSATEIVHFVGAEAALVGVTHECDYPSGVESLPKLTATPVDCTLNSAEIDAAIGKQLNDTGSIYSLDTELLIELKPDLVITQGLCDVCAVSLSVVEQSIARLPSSPRILSLNPTSLSEVLDTTIEVGDDVGGGVEARAKVSALRRRLTYLEEAVKDLPQPCVGCIEWLDPPFSAGHWVPQMVHMAGGEELFAGIGEPSRHICWKDVFEAAPEVVVLMPCGFDVARTLREAQALPEFPGWGNIPAVKNGRVWAVDANSYFSRPAPRLIEGVEILARILHPHAFVDSPGAKEAVRFTASAAHD